MQQIREALAKALKTQEVSVQPEDIHLEHTEDFAHGDYASNVALAFAKQLKMPPRELAEKLAAEARDIEGIAAVEVAGPGFINFTLSLQYLVEMLEMGRTHGEKWGSGTGMSEQKVMVEYTDPNPFKEFHIGHLMSNAIGESVSRLIEFSGADVKRANYQGDVGPHVAKAIFAKKRSPEIPWGVAYKMGNDLYEAFKDDIDELNRKIYDHSDKKINVLYEEGRNATLAEFEVLYKKLGTKFDFYFFESETAPRGVKIVRAHPELFEESDGAIVFKGEKYGLHTRVFITSQGLPTYEAKELGLAEMKAEKATFDTSITITAHEQSDYFKVVKKAMELVMPDLAGKIEHISHGMMRLEGGKMSSRTGNVLSGVWLIGILTEVARARATESRATDKNTLAEQVAIAAIKYQILKGGTGKDIVFDQDRALSVEGDSGPYLQYTHARTHAIMEKAKEAGVEGKFDATQPANDLSDAKAGLARLVYRFYETVLHAQEELEPHIVANYLISVASAFNSWYAQEQILDGTPAAAHKVALTDITRLTLKNGLWLLGISAPEKV